MIRTLIFQKPWIDRQTPVNSRRKQSDWGLGISAIRYIIFQTRMTRITRILRLRYEKYKKKIRVIRVIRV